MRVKAGKTNKREPTNIQTTTEQACNCITCMITGNNGTTKYCSNRLKTRWLFLKKRFNYCTSF